VKERSFFEKNRMAARAGDRPGSWRRFSRISKRGARLLNACDTARADSSGVNPFSRRGGSAGARRPCRPWSPCNFPISDLAAIAFSTAFYQRLAWRSRGRLVVEGRKPLIETQC